MPGVVALSSLERLGTRSLKEKRQSSAFAGNCQETRPGSAGSLATRLGLRGTSHLSDKSGLCEFHVLGGRRRMQAPSRCGVPPSPLSPQRTPDGDTGAYAALLPGRDTRRPPHRPLPLQTPRGCRCSAFAALTRPRPGPAAFTLLPPDSPGAVGAPQIQAERIKQTLNGLCQTPRSRFSSDECWRRCPHPSSQDVCSQARRWHREPLQAAGPPGGGAQAKASRSEALGPSREDRALSRWFPRGRRRGAQEKRCGRELEKRRGPECAPGSAVEATGPARSPWGRRVGERVGRRPGSRVGRGTCRARQDAHGLEKRGRGTPLTRLLCAPNSPWTPSRAPGPWRAARSAASDTPAPPATPRVPAAAQGEPGGADRPRAAGPQRNASRSVFPQP